MALSVETLVLAKNFAKSYADSVISGVAGGINYKGAVDYYSDLPNNPLVNDAYTVKYSGSSGTEPDGTEYVYANYEGTDQWIALGPDLSTFQKTLVSGENIKSINNQSILGSGDIDTEELYECTYGTTTYADITAALIAGKLPYFNYNDRQYFYQFTRNDGAYFFGCFDGSALTFYTGYVTNNNNWSTPFRTAENSSNKVTSITDASTDTQYPSAKLLYDQLLLKQNLR